MFCWLWAILAVVGGENPPSPPCQAALAFDLVPLQASDTEEHPAWGPVAFAPGVVLPTQRWEFCDQVGECYPAEMRPVWTWPDGSVRAGRVLGILPPRLRGPLNLVPAIERYGDPSEVFSVRERSGKMSLRTGPLRVVVQPRGCWVEIEGPGGAKLSLDLPGGKSGATGGAARVVFGGSVGLDIVSVRRLPGDESRPSLETQLTLRMFRQTGRIEASLWTHAITEGLSEGVPFRLAAKLGSRLTLADPLESIPLRGASRVEYRSTPFGSSTRSIDGEAEPWTSNRSLPLRLGGGRGCLEIKVHRFDELAPKRLSVDGRGRMALDLHPETLAWQKGSGVRLDFELALRERGATKPSSGITRGAPRLQQRGGGIGADPWIEGWRLGSLPEGSALKDSMKRLFHHMGQVQGALDYGDLRRRRGDWSNLEFDPVLALGLSWIATGDSRALDAMADMVSHWTVHDIARDGEDEGLPYQHGLEHRSDRFELGHVTLSGALLAEVLIDDPLLPDVLKTLGVTLPRRAQQGDLFHNERSVGWTLLNLADLARTRRSENARRVLEALLPKVLASQSTNGAFVLDRLLEKGEPYGSVNLWVTCVTTAEALRACEGLDSRCRGARESLLDFVASQIGRTENPSRVRFDLATMEPTKREGILGRADRLLVASALVRGARDCHRPTWRAKALWLLEELTVNVEALANESPTQSVKALRGLTGLGEFADFYGATDASRR